ncbi:hypothetical protein [uncultured Lacinutrix sp.]|uniref:hypothetical protein n=1 Tax=uncultured Lacinutrix sp. TaxID=574032 RepID=UPI00260B2EBA|nr:hypothetical protein [uncultured Lacinutrix sp.]
MRIKLLFIALTLTLSACGQSTESKKQNSEKTLVLGTRIYLDQPKNFKPSQDFIGFESGQSLIQFMELFGGNYNSNAKNFTKENFENKGIKVFDFQELKIDDYPAKLAFLQGNQNQKSLQLVFGDNEFSVMVMAFIPDFEKDKIEEIKKALLTIEYDKKRTVDPFEIAFFELDDSKSSYKYSKTVSNMFLYTKNGVKKDHFTGESVYLVSQIPTNRLNMSPKSLFENNLNSLKSNGLAISKREVTDRKKLNGFKCYEELIIGTLNNEETQIKMTSVVNGTRAVLINALVKDNFEKTFMEFDKLTNELKMK